MRGKGGDSDAEYSRLSPGRAGQSVPVRVWTTAANIRGPSAAPGGFRWGGGIRRDCGLKNGGRNRRSGLWRLWPSPFPGAGLLLQRRNTGRAESYLLQPH